MKNVFGDLEYTMEYSGKEFFVPHRTGNTGKYAILKRGVWAVHTAYIQIGEHGEFWWEETPSFDSWIHAIRYLKDHIEDLL